MKIMNSLLPCLNRISLFATIAIAAILLCCCEKDPEPLFDNGMITGKVDIDNPGGTLNGNNVRIIAHGPYGDKSTLSDYEGNYELSRLGNGTYEIEFKKEGYGIYRRPGIQIFGNDTLTIGVRLYKKVNYKMPKLGEILYYLPSADLHSVGIVTDLPADNTDEIQVRIFLSDNKGVNFKNYMYTEIPYSYYRDNATQLMLFNADPGIVNTEERIFQHGQSRYMIAYVCDRNDAGYFNEYYGLTIYSTVDEQQHSRVYEIKFP
jgi:hypothetical protein